MKKVAIPTREGQVDDHFGHCDYYTIFTIEDGKVSNEETFKAPEGCGCKSNVGAVLASMGVQTMLAGNMGMGALGVLNSNGIDVIRGCSGNVKDVITQFIKGEVADSGEGCHSHDNCNH